MNSLPLSCHGDANSSLPPLEERNDDVALNSLPLSCFTDGGGGDEKRHVRPPTAGFEEDGGDRPVNSRSYGGEHTVLGGVEYSAMAGTTMIFY